MIRLNRVCFRCGIEFNPGDLAYQMRIQMAADFDGYIDGDSLESSNESTDRISRQIEERTSEELTEEVYRERTLLFCKTCAEEAWKSVTEPKLR
jgi:hypothetical protein